MMRHLGGSRRIGGRLLAFALLALVAACTTPDFRFASSPADGSSARERHPIVVDRSTATLKLPATSPAGAALDDADRSRLDAFLADYGARGRGQILVIVPGHGADKAAARARGEEIARYASSKATGSDVSLGLDPSDGGSEITVLFNTYAVRASTCRDWSKESSHDPTNTSPPDMGCSLQRSLGLMVANPADLVTPRAVDLHDTQRSNLVVQLYRAGKATVSATSSQEQTSISDVGKPNN